MNSRIEVDVALLGYAIQIEREAQYEKPSKTSKHKTHTGEILQEYFELSNLKTKK